jgi:hypothetical protein
VAAGDHIRGVGRSMGFAPMADAENLQLISIILNRSVIMAKPRRLEAANT